MRHEITSNKKKGKDSQRGQGFVFVNRRTLAVLFVKENRLITETGNETEIVNRIISPEKGQCRALKISLAAFYLHWPVKTSQKPTTILISQMRKQQHREVR
jgi:hypothetical protein